MAWQRDCAELGRRLLFWEQVRRCGRALIALPRTTGVVVHGIVGDLVREEEVPNIYKRLVESLDGQADILVNCAGVQHQVRGRRFSDGRVESDFASKFRCYVPDVSAGGAGYAAAWIRQNY